MRLQELVEASNAVAQTRGRLEKIAILAALVKKASPGEIRVAVSYLSGALLQGRVGVGWSVIAGMREVTPAVEPTLELHEVHDAFDRLACAKGAGVTRARSQILQELFGRATASEH